MGSEIFCIMISILWGLNILLNLKIRDINFLTAGGLKKYSAKFTCHTLQSPISDVYVNLWSPYLAELKFCDPPSSTAIVISSPSLLQHSGTEHLESQKYSFGNKNHLEILWKRAGHFKWDWVCALHVSFFITILIFSMFSTNGWADYNTTGKD